MTPDSVVAGQAVSDEEAGTVKKGPLIKAGAVAHATLVTREDLKGIKVPHPPSVWVSGTLRFNGTCD